MTPEEETYFNTVRAKFIADLEDTFCAETARKVMLWDAIHNITVWDD